jgi:hypothetical protein
MRISANPLTSPADTSAGTMMQTGAFYNFPDSLSGTPFSSVLQARLNNPVTSGQAFTQVDSAYDTSGGSGTADALIYSDQNSDTTDGAGIRTQQEYKLAYNLFDSFIDPALYTDLVHESLFQFFNKYQSTITGTFDELGTTSSLDPVGLGLAPYAFTEYTGNVSLQGVQDVPEPGSLLLSLAAVVGMAGAMRARKSRA